MVAKLQLSTTEKPTLKLLGTNGNAFAVIGAAQKAWRRAKLPESDWDMISAEAMSGDYDHLLSTIMEYFDVE
jgi:hypothetical protein